MKCSWCWQVTFYKSISSSFPAFGSHQFIKDSALLLLNPLKHLPLYLFSFSESDFNPAHYISVLPNNPKENVILTYWRENHHTIDSLRSLVLQESYHDSSVMEGEITLALLFLSAYCFCQFSVMSTQQEPIRKKQGRPRKASQIRFQRSVGGRDLCVVNKQQTLPERVQR